MASPYPVLNVHPLSGLSFPWSEYHPDGKTSSSDASFGSEGVTAPMVILVRWDDLLDPSQNVIQRLMGYSWRDTSGSVPLLRRDLPWQHPKYNQLWVKNISGLKGLRLAAKEDAVVLGGGGSGPGPWINRGPASRFDFAQITLNFWRPPYAVRSDLDIPLVPGDTGGRRQEWLRYMDREWSLSTQMLSREGSTFVWAPGQTLTANPFQGSVGQKMTKLKLKRTWYQIPEAALFNLTSDQTASGEPNNLLYGQGQYTNPITNYVAPVGAPITACVNLPVGGGTLQGSAPYVLDNIGANRFFGFPMGTLLYEGVEILPRPLQLPAALMRIPIINTEAVSQVQYDVVFHFEFFNPPRSPSGGAPAEWSGHNLMPFSGNGFWYAVQSQLGKDGATTPSPTNPALTPFHYADFSDLFKIL